MARLTHAVEDPRWAAVSARANSADGTFYYGVRTTGVYCRPSCPSRLARRENVTYYLTCEAAERAGFRPCKRCRPRDASPSKRQAALIARACRLIESGEMPPDLRAIANSVGLSRYHFHRVFKAITGVTPKAYADAHRNEQARRRLHKAKNVTCAIYEAGFNSHGRFYASAAKVLGMTPGRFRAGGAHTQIQFAVGECSLGSILVAATTKGVCAILLGDDPELVLRELQDQFPRAELLGGDAKFEALVAKVVGFVEQPRLGLDLPLDVRGTAFQRRVWQALQRIGVGRTVSYAEVAERIGKPEAVRAVAQACAANTLAVAIPCHRVVKNDGAISGYRWGIVRKQVLLAREGAIPA
jgi:AraC family transcriptional regulator, regulatory protein of adaptative response / methylated-DNA-[protein]-cysteine methyltransferase